MSFQVFGRDLRASLRFLLLLLVGTVFFAGVMTAIYPSVRGSFQDLLKTVPSFFRPMVESRMSFKTFEGFASVAFTHPVMLALFSAWPIARGAQAIAGEIERGTLGWMLSYPVGRLPFLMAKAAAMLLGCAIVPLVFVSTLWGVSTYLAIPHVGPGPYLWAALMTFLMYGSLGALTLWCSAAYSERGPAILIGTTFLLANFLWNYVAELWSPLKPLHFLSLFDYYDPKAALYGNAIEPRTWLVLGGLLVVSLVGAAATFRRRDLTI